MVGAEGFEPSAFCSRSKRATRLRYGPLPKFVLINSHPPKQAHIIPYFRSAVNGVFSENFISLLRAPPPTIPYFALPRHFPPCRPNKRKPLPLPKHSLAPTKNLPRPYQKFFPPLSNFSRVPTRRNSHLHKKSPAPPNS